MEYMWGIQYTHITLVIQTVFLLSMPPCQLNQLTSDEEKLLIHAAKILRALKAYMVTLLTTQEQRDCWTESLDIDIVCTFLYPTYPSL